MDQEKLIGRTIGGRFRIESFLGEGAMGRVYRARQLALGTTVALKVMHETLACIPAVAARFLREAQAASRIDHPSSVRVIDFGKEPDGLLYFAMELIRGKSLAEILVEDGPMPAARIVEIASQILAALAVAHELGVVHRDLKPENIMVLEGKDDDGRPCDVVKVCDFGIAKLVDDAGSAPTVTQEGTMVGTPAYMSPEQARGEALDGRSDIYAMGVLLFQMMTGEVPFDASSPFGTVLKHATEEPTKPTLLVPTVDSRLEAICLRAMRKRPEERYATARELRAELRALFPKDASEAIEPARTPPSIAPTTLRAQVEVAPSRTNRLVAGAAIAGAAVVAAFLFGVKPEPEAAPSAATEPVATTASPSIPPPPAEVSGDTVDEVPSPATDDTAEAPAKAPTASRSASRRTGTRAATPARTPAITKVNAKTTDAAATPTAATPAAATPAPAATTPPEPREETPDEPLPSFIPRPDVPAIPEVAPPAPPPPEPAPAPPEPAPAAPPAPEPAPPPLPPG